MTLSSAAGTHFGPALLAAACHISVTLCLFDRIFVDLMLKRCFERVKPNSLVRYEK